MKKKISIKTKYTPNEEFYREFNRTWRYRNRIFQYGMVVLMTFLSFILLLMGDYDFCIKYNIFIVCFLLFCLFLDHNVFNYKQLLVRLNNEIQDFETVFQDDKMVTKVGKNKQDYEYSLVRSVIDGEKLLIVKLPSNLGIIVEKGTMGKEDIKELKQLLLEKCNIKKITIVPNGIYILKMIAWILAIINFCVSLVLFITK